MHGTRRRPVTMTTWTLPDDASYQPLQPSLGPRSQTFVIPTRHKRTRSDGTQAAAAAAAEATGTRGHQRLSQRLSLDTRPTQSTSQRPTYRTHGGEFTQQGSVTESTENEDSLSSRSSGSSSDENALSRRDRRPQSAWNSRSGRRPHFTFTDLNDDQLSEGKEATSDATRRKSTRPRGSQIPVRTDRLHPGNADDHAGDRSRRHSVYGTESGGATSAMSDLSRDQQSTSGHQKAFRRRSLTDDREVARRRVLVRLTGSDDQPEEEMTSSTVSRRPRKLDPILSPSAIADDVDHLRLEERPTARMTSPKVASDDVTSGFSDGEVGRHDGSYRLRPVVSRKARELMMM